MEEHFQQMLDENPEDHETRLVFADWLQEQGDPRAERYRELGRRRVSPYPAMGGYLGGRHKNGSGPNEMTWEYWNRDKIDFTSSIDVGIRNHSVPYWWLSCANGVRYNSTGLASMDYKTRREADDDMALTYSKTKEGVLT